MDRRERSQGKVCDSSAYEERAEEFFCRGCKSYKREELSFSEKKELLRKAAIWLSRDDRTPEDILRAEFVNFTKTGTSERTVYGVEFLYDGKRY